VADHRDHHHPTTDPDMKGREIGRKRKFIPTRKPGYATGQKYRDLWQMSVVYGISFDYSNYRNIALSSVEGSCMVEMLRNHCESPVTAACLQKRPSSSMYINCTMIRKLTIECNRTND